MIKEFLTWLKHVELCAWIRNMKRTLKRAEDLYNILATDDLVAFTYAFKIDGKIQECQELIKQMEAMTEKFDPKNFSK